MGDVAVAAIRKTKCAFSIPRGHDHDPVAATREHETDEVEWNPYRDLGNSEFYRPDIFLGVTQQF
jgi:hypothetical protein